VFVGGRDADKAEGSAARIGAAGSGTLREAAEFGETVLLAVRIAGLADALEAAGAGEGTLAGKTIVDCGNAVNTADFSLITFEGGTSSSEEAARLAPGAHVVKAFNQCQAAVWRTDPVFDGRTLAVPYAGDEAGKAVARQLIRDVGADPLDAGDLAQTRNLEAMAIVVIRLLFSGYDPMTAFSFSSPGRTGEPFASR
jgi:predicted dinucleotide-binding enzyme